MVGLGGAVSERRPVSTRKERAGERRARLPEPPLVARGAVRAQSPGEAAGASPLVVVCVIDYDAVAAILADADDALNGRTVVNRTADSPERARAMAAWAGEHGIA